MRKGAPDFRASSGMVCALRAPPPFRDKAAKEWGTGWLCGFLFVAGFYFEPDGGSDEAEGLAHLVFQKALEAEVQLHIAVCEQDEGRRSDRRLRHVIDLYALVHRNRGALEVDVGEEAVHLACRDALAALACDLLDLAEDRIYIDALGGGDEK